MQNVLETATCATFSAAEPGTVMLSAEMRHGVGSPEARNFASPRIGKSQLVGCVRTLVSSADPRYEWLAKELNVQASEHRETRGHARMSDLLGALSAAAGRT